jgi:ATP-dependent Clp protease ATP-binding subunit ClpX
MDQPGSTDAASSPTCSFCRKSYRHVGPLIESPELDNGVKAYICRDCVELCAQILDQERQKREAAAPGPAGDGE